MEKTPATMMREYVNSQKFESTADIMTAMKEMFGDALQQVMDCNLEEKLGYEKASRCRKTAKTVCQKTIGTGTQK